MTFLSCNTTDLSATNSTLNQIIFKRVTTYHVVDIMLHDIIYILQKATHYHVFVLKIKLISREYDGSKCNAKHWQLVTTIRVVLR